MQQETVVITNETGLHARPATLFAQTAARFSSAITIAKGDKKVDAKSILMVLTLGAGKGSEITITADGSDEAEAVAALVDFLKNHKE